jgi:ubiquinone/menaquinone biosynthesis C-methylase UbiE
VHISFVDYLVDPITKEPLEINIIKRDKDIIESGLLVSSTGEYPIINGIPRFISNHLDNYADSFGYEWHKWQRTQFDSENIGKPIYGYTSNMWERITGIQTDLTGKIILDIGCGPGRFIEVARKKNAICIGIDYSQAVEVAADNFHGDSNVCICQADALNLPIKTDILDGAFAIGVLHHTPNPLKGVREAFRVIKSGGWFALSVYGKRGYYDYFIVTFWRQIFKSLWPIFKHYPALIYSYLTVYVIKTISLIPYIGKYFCKAMQLILPCVILQDINWSLLDTFDSITPSYQSTHESYEVFQWFKTCDFKNIEPTNWGFTAYHGNKS